MEVSILYLIIVIAVLVFVYRRITKDDDYFHDKPIPSLAVKPLLGSTGKLLLRRCTFNDFVRSIYEKYQGVKVFGLLDTSTPIFVLRDLELIKKLAVKDFDYFMDRRPIFGDSAGDNEDILFGKTLVGMRGQKWREMRATLSPTFTGSKMRAMFEFVVEYSDKMNRILRKEAEVVGFVDFDMKDLFSRIASDIIATCAFGLQIDSLKNRDNEFYVMGKKMMNFNRFIVFLRMMGFRFFPKLMQRFGIDVIDREQNQYFSQIIRDAVRTREAHGIVRPDMIHLLLQAKKGILKHQQDTIEVNESFATAKESDVGKANVCKSMTEPEFIAQCLIFFLAGFDSVSTMAMFMSYELALNPDVQEKLYKEIQAMDTELGSKPLSYDSLQKLKFMDMVVSETLRMWPNATMERQCVKDYTFDDGEGLRFTIEKDSCVWFPAAGIQKDPKYYPNPDTFDPERFSEANRAGINVDTYLPFGVGPRNCIGSRFALMEIKAIMYRVLLSFSIERNEKTEVPIKIVKGFTGLASEKGAQLRLKLRQ